MWSKLSRYEDVCKTEYETVYDTVTETKCETQYETEYTTEFDTVCDTVYEQKCEVGSFYIYSATVDETQNYPDITFWEDFSFSLGFLLGKRKAPILADLGKDEDDAELAKATRGIPFNWHSRGMCAHTRSSTVADSDACSALDGVAWIYVHSLDLPGGASSVSNASQKEVKKYHNHHPIFKGRSRTIFLREFFSQN